ncbi:MAG: hypothetical protein MJZ33_10040 [Paludibacteraceae bacterium]|nr:hypothetical protein [Paludibacteraceae bacterium]
MESFKDIESCLVELSNGDIVERQESIARSLFFFSFGIVLLLLGRYNEYLANVVTWQLTIYFVSVIFFLAGVMKFFFRKTHYLYLPTKEVMQRIELNFNSTEVGQIERTYGSGNFVGMYEFRSDCNSCYRMVLYVTKNGEVCFVQLMKYEPFEFYPVTQAHRCEGEQLQSIRVLLRRMSK